MAVDSRLLVSYLAGDTEFRAWGQGIAAQLVACGLVKTADTGQIDWTTATRPTVANAVAGYEIYRFNDTLQATAPVYIKIEYGVGTVTDRPNIYYTVSSSTNGAGTLNGAVVSTRTGVGPAQSATAGNTYTHYASGSQAAGALGGRVTLFGCVVAGTNLAFFMHIERTRDGSGVPTADGLLMFAAGNLASAGNIRFAVQTMSFTSGVTVPTQIVSLSTVWSGPGYISGNFGLVGSIAANVALSPWIVFMGKALFGCLLMYLTTDLPGSAQAAMNSFGAAHTYMTTTWTSLTQVGGQGNTLMAFPYE